MERQDPQSREFMLQLTKELVDQDLDKIIEERLQERYPKRKQSDRAVHRLSESDSSPLFSGDC
jgi:hypothetical protein